jgi:predicted RNase H-like nuclease (RuvC/YqgF family)
MTDMNLREQVTELFATLRAKNAEITALTKELAEAKSSFDLQSMKIIMDVYDSQKKRIEELEQELYIERRIISEACVQGARHEINIAIGIIDQEKPKFRTKSND